MVVVVAVALGVGLLVLIVRVQQNTDRLQRQVVAARRAEYRICTRQMVNRAALDTDLTKDEGKLLPLYDCSPNLVGRPARRLTDGEASAYRMKVLATPESQLP
jgi:hypothetical protein